MDFRVLLTPAQCRVAAPLHSGKASLTLPAAYAGHQQHKEVWHNRQHHLVFRTQKVAVTVCIEKNLTQLTAKRDTTRPESRIWLHWRNSVRTKRLHA